MALYAFSDLPTLNVINYTQILDVLVPLRLTAYFALSAWAYLVYNPYLSNGLTFSLGFVEIIFNFWLFVTVREERNEALGKSLKSRHHRENSG
jgi:hypothetical protein